MPSKGSLFIIVLLLLFGTGSNPKAETVKEDVKVCERETATLVCGTDGHKASYLWRFPSRKRVPNKTDKYEQLKNGAILLVKNVDHSDVKNIRFISCSTHGDDMRRITYLYKIMINCENFQTPVGSSLRLSCKVDVPDDNLDYIIWTFKGKRHSKIESTIMLFKKDGKATSDSSLKFNGRISVQNRTLLIQNIKMEDIGVYRCAPYRKKNFHLGKGYYHYNVNVTSRITTKPAIIVNATNSTKTITPSPSIGYTVEPVKTATLNSTSSQPKFTTLTTPTRKTTNVSTGSMQDSTRPTTNPKHSTQSSVVQTNIRSTPRPTSASLPNKTFTTQTKDLLPTTSGTANETLKHDPDTTDGSSRTFPSKWLFLFLMFNLIIN